MIIHLIALKYSLLSWMLITICHSSSPETKLEHKKSLFGEHQHNDEANQQHVNSDSPWTYRNEAEWTTKYKYCGMNSQSPINIDTKKVKAHKSLKLSFHNYNNLVNYFIISNEHHTIKISPIKVNKRGLRGSSFKPRLLKNDDIWMNDNYPNKVKRKWSPELNIEHEWRRANDHVSTTHSGFMKFIPTRPMIHIRTPQGLNGDYDLHDIHLHWSPDGLNGSEHAIDGMRSSMEIHIVHIKRGITKDLLEITPDALVVIGVQIQVDESYKPPSTPTELKTMLSQINGTSNQVEITLRSLYKQLIPKKDGRVEFYHYKGSLTTPPCFETVNWIVMKNIFKMEKARFELFANLKNSDGNFIAPNLRSLKPLNERVVYRSV